MMGMSNFLPTKIPASFCPSEDPTIFQESGLYNYFTSRNNQTRKYVTILSQSQQKPTDKKGLANML
jgi:hypothetical protein